MSKEVTAFEAKTRLGQLLDRVESGEQITITRHGQAIAMLVPLQSKADRLDSALQKARVVRDALTKRGVKITRQDIRDFINEGRR